MSSNTQQQRILEEEYYEVGKGKSETIIATPVQLKPRLSDAPIPDYRDAIPRNFYDGLDNSELGRLLPHLPASQVRDRIETGIEYHTAYIQRTSGYSNARNHAEFEKDVRTQNAGQNRTRPTAEYRQINDPEETAKLRSVGQ